MAEQYVGEIRMFAGAFAPVGWTFCNGALLSIANNQTLYALLGTVWGGDGVSTFGVPDLRGRLPVGQGQGPGLSSYVLGQRAGVDQVTLLDSNMPSHNHNFLVASSPATTTNLSSGAGFAAPTTNTTSGALVDYAPVTSSPVHLTLSSHALTPYQGGAQPHDNHMPSLSVNYIIATVGVFPTRN